MKTYTSLKELSFAQPFKITYETVEKVKIIYLCIMDERGLFGLGSASPDGEVTGEKIEESYAKIKNLENDFFDEPVENWQNYHVLTQKRFGKFPALASCVEEAIFNLFCKRNKISLQKLLGGTKENCHIAYTLGIKGKEETLKEFEAKKKEGFTFFKLKVGLNVEEDLVKIKEILSISEKEEIGLAIDANQGYSKEEAIYLIKETNKLDLSFIEQPIVKNDLGGLKKLKDLSSNPIIADESAVNYEDALYLLSNDYIDGLNIKLMKCGGIINFLKIYYLTKQFDKKVMIGCNYESNISITTGASLALALNMDFVEVDSGKLDFPNELVSGGAEVKKGEIYLGEKLKFKKELFPKCGL